MSQSTIHESPSSPGCSRSADERARDELARLGLIYADPHPIRLRGFAFDRQVERSGQRGRMPAIAGGVSLSKPVSLAARLAILAGAGTIASLAMLFG